MKKTSAASAPSESLLKKLPTMFVELFAALHEAGDENLMGEHSSLLHLGAEIVDGTCRAIQTRNKGALERLHTVTVQADLLLPAPDKRSALAGPDAPSTKSKSRAKAVTMKTRPKVRDRTLADQYQQLLAKVEQVLRRPRNKEPDTAKFGDATGAILNALENSVSPLSRRVPSSTYEKRMERMARALGELDHQSLLNAEKYIACALRAIGMKPVDVKNLGAAESAKQRRSMPEK